MKKIQSSCNYCTLACNFDFYVENNTITNLVPTADYPVNKGFSCIKGLYLGKQNTLYKPSPLPRIKDASGERQLVSWDQAFTDTANKLQAIIAEHGNESVAGLSTGQIPLEEMALLGHVMRNYLQANLDGNTRLCMATSVVAHRQSFGFDAPPYTLNDLELSDTIVLIGANPVVAHPIVWDRIKKNPNPDKKIIVIDPRHSETAHNATHYYGLKSKSDLVFFYTLAQVLIENHWIDTTYIAQHTEQFEAFKAFVADYTLTEVEARTGITAEAMLTLAQLIHTGQNVSFWWTMGVNQGYEAVRTAQSIINLALMTGNMGRPGTGANSLTGQPNAMGSRLYSNQAGLYGGGDYDNPKRIQAVSEALSLDPKWLPKKPTLPYNAIIEKINAGEIKALWVVATNPRHSWANNATFQAAIDKLDLLIVQDIYDDTDTSQHAHVFFPVVSMLKKQGTVINTERRFSAIQPVLTREANEYTDFEVFLGMGKALGMGALLDSWQTPEAVFELMKLCSKGMPGDFTGITYPLLQGTKGIQWPFRAGETLSQDERRLFEDGNYYTPSQKAQFIFETPVDNPIPVTAAYPYILNTGRGTVGQWHTQTRTREIEPVSGAVASQAYVLIHPELAQAHGITNQQPLTLEAYHGVRATFEARLSPDIPADQLYAPIHYLETNALTPSVYDPYSKEPSYKTTPVAIVAKGV